MSRIRGDSPRRQQLRAGAPGRVADGERGPGRGHRVVGRLGVVEELDAAVGPVKQRDRGYGAGELLTGIAAAQLAGRISWPGWTGSAPMRRVS